MKNIIVDSNIIFSSLRSSHSITRRRIKNSKDTLYAPNFLIGEIFKHKERILRKSNASEEETYEYLFQVLNKINFINEKNISTRNFILAYHLCKDIDEKDTTFIALSLEMGYEVWTRDQILKNGLRQKGFDNFFDE